MITRSIKFAVFFVFIPLAGKAQVLRDSGFYESFKYIISDTVNDSHNKEFINDSIYFTTQLSHFYQFHTLTCYYYYSGSVKIALEYPDQGEIYIFRPCALKVTSPGYTLRKIEKKDSFIILYHQNDAFYFTESGKYLAQFYKVREPGWKEEYYNISFHDLTIEEGMGIDLSFPDKWYNSGKISATHLKQGIYLYYYTFWPDGGIKEINIFKKKETAANDGFYDFYKTIIY